MTPKQQEYAAKALPDALALVTDANQVLATATSPGYKTSEFWLIVGTWAIGAAAMLWGLAKGNDLALSLGATLTGGATTYYNQTRAKMKREGVKAPAATPPTEAE